MPIKAYYRLTKPRMVYMNVAVAAAAFIYGSHTTIDWQAFVAMLAGLGAIVASACVFNNYADRFIDAKMERTKKRALVSGAISVKDATIFGYLLAIPGLLELYLLTDYTAFFTALVGFAVYVFAYTPMKPKSRYALFVGAIAGATPPVVGYTAVTDVYDGWALLLFILLFLWQLPHFIAIATYRFEDYSMAGVPLFARAPKNDKERKIAKQVFFASLVVLLVACLGLALWRLLF